MTAHPDIRGADAQVAMFRALSDVPAETWDGAIGAGQGALLHAFLAPLDKALDQASWRVFTARGADGSLRAVSPGLVHTVDLADSASEVGRAAIATARRLVRGAFRARVLELGPPCCPGAPIAAADPAALPELTELIVQAAWHEVVARGEADALMVREFAGAAPGAIERRLEELGFALVAERPTFIVGLDAHTFASYLAAMRAPYRRRAEHYLRADFRVSITADFAERAEEIARLFEITTSRARESRRERIGADAVRAWARCDRARAVFLETGARGLELAALVLEDRPVLHFVRVGFDADVSRSTGAYPRLLYELVRFAIERGCSFIDLGLTSADPKLRAGAQPVPLRVWVRHRNAAIQALLRGARRFFASVPPAPIRHVFRSAPGDIRPSWFGGGAS
jgi:hypothetical protein